VEFLAVEQASVGMEGMVVRMVASFP